MLPLEDSGDSEDEAVLVSETRIKVGGHTLQHLEQVAKVPRVSRNTAADARKLAEKRMHELRDWHTAFAEICEHERKAACAARAAEIAKSQQSQPGQPGPGSLS